MAFTVTRYRANNPGQNTRYFDITALDADLTTTFAHNCGWTPDDWDLVSTDGTACMYAGVWRAQVNATQVIITKSGAGSSGGAVRLTLNHSALRP